MSDDSRELPPRPRPADAGERGARDGAKAPDRQARLAEALRANLRRRKAQARARAAHAAPKPDEP